MNPQCIVTNFSGETLYLPPRIAHAILNLEDNVSVTENLLLETNLEDLVHGLVMGDSVLEPGTRDNERIWRSAILFVSQPLQSCLSDNLYIYVTVIRIHAISTPQGLNRLRRYEQSINISLSSHHFSSMIKKKKTDISLICLSIAENSEF